MSQRQLFLSNSVSVGLILVVVAVSCLCGTSQAMMANSHKKARFVTNTMCPFAHKAWIALEIAKIPYEMEEIGLYGAGGKPDWFWKLNPQGTVPVLVTCTGAVLTESDAILDYAQAQMTDSIPSDAPERIHQLRSLVNQRLLPSGKQAVLQNKKQKLAETLDRLEEDYRRTNSAYLAGDIVSTADCQAFPFLWRIRQEFGDDVLDPAQHPGLCQWLDRCESLPTFRNTIPRSWWWWW